MGKEFKTVEIEIALKNTGFSPDVVELVLSNLQGTGPKGKANVLIADIRTTFVSCLATAIKKNNDYAGESTHDPYKNFKNSVTVGVVPSKAIMVRMMDKISRVSNLLQQDNAVKSESITDTLDDLINYTAILKSVVSRNIDGNETVQTNENLVYGIDKVRPTRQDLYLVTYPEGAEGKSVHRYMYWDGSSFRDWQDNNLDTALNLKIVSWEDPWENKSNF